jgi:uncharacterized RDD family membrane protein YckC
VSARSTLLLVLLLIAAQARQEGSGRGGRLRLGNITGSVGNRVIEEVDVDAIVRRIDVDALVARIDVEALVARIDVEAVLDRVDVNGLLARVDVDGLLDRVDVDRLLDRVDVDGLLDRVDVDRLLDRVEVDRLLDRADVDRLLARIDVDAVASRIDLDAQVRRIDLDAVVAQVDLDTALASVDVEDLVRRAGVPELIAESTGQAANSALDLARRQLVAVDVGLIRLLQRLLRRDPGTLAPGPPLLVTNRHGVVQDPSLSGSRTRARAEVSGYYAGPASRILAFAGDVVASAAAFTATMVTISWLLAVAAGLAFETAERSGPVWAVAFGGWYLLWWWVTVSVSGRTPVMALVGLKVVSRAGAPISAGRALLRALVQPLSVGLFGAGFALMLIDRERRALHDVLSGAAVVYDWGGRPAELPAPITRWLLERGAVTPGSDQATQQRP